MRAERVLVTGASGLIGGILLRDLGRSPEQFEVHAMARSRVPRGKGADLADHGLYEIPAQRFHLADLGDRVAVGKAVQGMDVVVHLAAIATGRADPAAIRETNIAGLQNIIEASRQAGVRRFVFASTIQVLFGYFFQEPLVAIREERIGDLPCGFPVLGIDVPTRPTSHYSCSKVWGEGLCWMYSQMHGLSCLCVRIGSVPADDRPTGVGRGHWCSHRDLAQLFRLCIAAPDSMRFDIFYAASDNRYRWVDIAHGRERLGYSPLDNAEDHFGIEPDPSPGLA